MTSTETNEYYQKAVLALDVLFNPPSSSDFSDFLLNRVRDPRWRKRMPDPEHIPNAFKVAHRLLDDLKTGKANFRYLTNDYNGIRDYCGGDDIYGVDMSLLAKVRPESRRQFNHLKFRQVPWNINWEKQKGNEDLPRPLLNLNLLMAEAISGAWGFNPFGKELFFVLNGCTQEGGESISFSLNQIPDIYEPYTYFHRLILLNRGKPGFFTPLEIIGWALNAASININSPVLPNPDLAPIWVSLHKPHYGATSLHLVVDTYRIKEQPAIINLLLNHKADPTIKNRQGATPLEEMQKIAGKKSFTSIQDSRSICLLADAMVKDNAGMLNKKRECAQARADKKVNKYPDELNSMIYASVIKKYNNMFSKRPYISAATIEKYIDQLKKGVSFKDLCETYELYPELTLRSMMNECDDRNAMSLVIKHWKGEERKKLIELLIFQNEDNNCLPARSLLVFTTASMAYTTLNAMRRSTEVSHSEGVSIPDARSICLLADVTIKYDEEESESDDE
jgi:hypothetical protein